MSAYKFDEEIDVPEEFKPIIPDFLKRREVEAQKMVVDLDAGNFESIQHVAHKLSGHGLGYGFPFLSKIGRQIEEAAKQKDSKNLQDLIATYLEFVKYVKKSFSF